MARIVVLGAGMVGKAIVADLCKKHMIEAVDIDPLALDFLSKKYPVQTLRLDINDSKNIQEVIQDAHLVIVAVPGFLGYTTLETVIKAGKNVIDISFSAKDPFNLDKLAKQNKVTAIVDCGIAPGLSNIILGYWSSKIEIESYECLVGGLPFVRQWPFEYKAPFSPIDVIEEYTRPARYVEDGCLVIKPALSDPELIHFKEIGTLEAFNTDGLRTLIKTMKIPNMKEKTLRYPGHIRLIQALQESGFFSEKPIDVNGYMIRPIDFTSKILFSAWKLNKEDKDFTVMRITLVGTGSGKRREIVYYLFDRFNRKTGLSSMARTTGYLCTAVANLVLEGKFQEKGISPPEYVGRQANCFKLIMRYLRERNIRLSCKKRQ